MATRVTRMSRMFKTKAELLKAKLRRREYRQLQREQQKVDALHDEVKTILVKISTKKISTQ